MKKLMFAVSAALCATVGFSDVTSANIVGYLNTTANTNWRGPEYHMLGTSFIRVGGDGTGCKVTDLSFTGYREVDSWKTAGGFMTSFIQVIDSKAVPVMKFTWVDRYNKETTQWDGGYWLDNISGKKVVETVVDEETEELPPIIPLGKGLWCNIGNCGKTTGPIQLVCAGQVLTSSEAITATTNWRGPEYVALCNPLARVVDLTEVSFTGYRELDTWKNAGGFMTSFIQIIDSKAQPLAKYTWVDRYNKETTQWAGGYWLDNISGKKVVKEVVNPETEETASIPAGQGLWCNVGNGSKTQYIYIVWPTLNGDDAE